MEVLKIHLYGPNFKENLAIVKSCDGRHYHTQEKYWAVPLTLNNLRKLSTIKSIGDDMLRRIEDMEINVERELLKATVTPEEAYKLKEEYPFLYDYQCVAAHFLLQKNKYLIADEMGTGKTIECMPYIDKMVKDGKKIIILCPSSIASQWGSEIDRFINLPSVNIVGMLKDKRLAAYANDNKIIITTYESFKNDVKILKEKNYKFANTCIIADEASKFKNKNTSIYKELRMISPYLYGFVALTGTPIENELENFFNIVSVINPNFMTRREFENRYCVMEGTGDRQKCSGYKNLKEFIHRIVTIMIRRTKRDITDLPPVVVLNRTIPMLKEQRFYTTRLRRYYGETYNLGCIVLLREVANDTGLLNNSSTIIQDMQKKQYIPMSIPSVSNKIPECLDILEELGDSQVIIFTQYAQMALKLGGILNKKGYNVMTLTGAHSIKERAEEVARFKSGTYQILIATDIFGYGINLQFCDFMINFDIPWNPAKLNQRIGRIHRQGNNRPKTVINLLCEDIDEHVFNVITGKQDLFDAVVEGKAIDDETIRKQILQKLI